MEGDGSRDSTMIRDFASKLIDFFGSLEAAFKRGDSGALGLMTHADLERLVKKIDLRCETRVLFSRLDPDRNGAIRRRDFLELKSLIRIGPPADIPAQPLLWQEGDDLANLDLLRDFAAVLYYSFNDLEEAFDAFDVSKLGRLSVSNFQWGTRSIGFEGDAKKLFVLMDAERGGTITREEFFSLDRLYQPAVSEADSSTNSQIEVILECPELGGGQDMSQVDMNGLVGAAAQTEGRARFPGCAEELAWLLQEDIRRNQELVDNGAAKVAEKNMLAATEACRAVEIDDLQFKFEFPSNVSRIQGTTSIDARIEMRDSWERRMWVQTAVVDRTGTGSSAADDAAFVVELRGRQCRGSENDSLCVQIDVSKIISIKQLGPGDFAEPSADLSFSVSFMPDAIIRAVPKVHTESDSPLHDVGGFSVAVGADSVEAEQTNRFFHQSEDGALLLHVVVGPSTWRRRDGIRFFDELRILVHFVTEGVAAAATSIGAAAGAAARNAARRKSSPM